MSWLKKVLFLSSLALLFASTFFINWISGIGSLITGFNSGVWSRIPFEFQIGIAGFLIVIVIAFLSWIINE